MCACVCVCVVRTIFAVVDYRDGVRRRLFHKGGLTVWTVAVVDRKGKTRLEDTHYEVSD